MRRTLPLLLCLAVPALPPRPAQAESFASWSAKAEKAATRRDNQAALAAYTNALRLWSKRDGAKAKARVLAARAALYEESGEIEQALEDIGEALKIEKKSPAHLHRRGRLQLSRGRASEAISDFYKAIALNLNFREAYFDRARAYEQTGEGKFAREDYRTACRLGFKKACAGASPAKARGPRAALVAAETVQEAAAGPVEIKKKRPRRRYPLDFEACLSGLEACVAEGAGFADCVNRAKFCEQGAEKGCCPEICVKHYRRLVSELERSEAAAFREIFVPKSPCLAAEL